MTLKFAFGIVRLSPLLLRAQMCGLVLHLEVYLLSVVASFSKFHGRWIWREWVCVCVCVRDVLWCAGGRQRRGWSEGWAGPALSGLSLPIPAIFLAVFPHAMWEFIQRRKFLESIGQVHKYFLFCLNCLVFIHKFVAVVLLWVYFWVVLVWLVSYPICNLSCVCQTVPFKSNK